MSALSLSVPESLGELWWIYPLILASVILIEIVLLSFYRRHSYKKEGEKNIENAIRLLNKIKNYSTQRKRINLITISNLLKSAIYNLTKHAEKNELYQLRLKVDELVKVRKKLNALSGLISYDNTQEFNKEVDEIIAIISE